MDWINLAYDRIKWQELVNTALHPRVQEMFWQAAQLLASNKDSVPWNL
jgi:hypothetical protein